MLKSLVWKETRELAPMAVLVVGLQWGIAFAMRLWDRGLSVRGPEVIPFIDGRFEYLVLVVAGLGAAMIGFRQASRESSRGTYLFLLHRPARRETLFGIKMVCGAAAVLLVGGLPLVLRALWAATPGTHASPFQWWMTLWTWVLLLQVPLFYLAGFLCGLRPGRWWASKALPIAAAIGAYVVLQGTGLYWPWGVLALCLLFEAALVVTILHVATTQDFS